ncbi:hypothetical protein SteCoe_11461 [Stentor coeruleus]|uniref:Uncharacterized protein n=1 Tax=Stentor coeruleus TaxID=5963 RepID=A0A1R2CD68_9CILI|nr:hypothetical protein SteCoe_11461 [Stentor coeruleus]
MLFKSRTLRRSQSSDHSLFSSSKIKLLKSIMKKLLIQASIRHHYINLMFFRQWANMKISSKIIESEENLQLKSHDVTIPHDSIIQNLDSEADDTMETIFSRTIHLKGIPRPTRKKLLRSSRRIKNDHIIQLEEIAKYMQKLSIAKKKIPRRFLKIWAVKAKKLEKTREMCRNVIYGLIRKRNLNRKMLRNALKALKEVNKKQKFDEENEGLGILANKAFEVKNAKKIIVMLWKEKVKKGLNIKAFKLAVMTMMKLRKAVVHPWVKVWKKVILDEIDKKKKYLLIEKLLNKVLAKSVQNVIKMIKSDEEFNIKRNEKLMKIIGKKHQINVEMLSLGFNMIAENFNDYKKEKLYKVEKMLEKIVDGFTENTKNIFKHIRREKKYFAIKKKNNKLRKLRSSARHTPNISMVKKDKPSDVSPIFIRNESAESFGFTEIAPLPKDNPNLQKAIEFLESNYKSAKLRRLSFVISCFKIISESFKDSNKKHTKNIKSSNHIFHNHKIRYRISINNNEFIPSNLNEIYPKNHLLLEHNNLEHLDENIIDTPGCFVW